MNRKTLFILAVLLMACGARYALSIDPNVPFVDATDGVDRIVIRSGGHDCCGNDVDSQLVFIEITEPAKVAEFSRHIRFKRRYPSLFGSVSRCRCCGYPGIDWYRGGKRVALTSIQHGSAVRWSDFGHYDEELTPQSMHWLSTFMRSNGIPETQL